MAKKKLDFKALLLNHGEKFGAAVVGLLALTGLATANWSGCSRLEAELRDAANRTRDAWSSPSNAWPDEKKEVFAKTPDVEAMAQRMASPNEDIEQFSFARHFNPPKNLVKEKLGAVVVLPPQFPESTLVEFTVVLKDEEELDEETSTEADKSLNDLPSSQKELEDLLGRASGAGVPGGLGNDLPGLGASGGLGLDSETGAGYSGGRGLGVGSSSGPGGMGSGMMGPGMMGSGMMGSDLGLDGYGGMMGMGEYGGGAPVEKKVRSCAGVSIRCVFDLYKQTNMLAESLHMPPQEIGPRYIDFVNLEIQRKRAVSGVDPWAGPWEPLPLKDIAEILDQAAYFDRDIVNPSVVRSEITMPLPSRAAGNWTVGNASHSMLEKFKLSEEEQDLIDKHQAKMLEEANRLKAMLPPEQAKSEGFRKYSLASQDLGMALGASSGMPGMSSMAGMPGMSTMSGISGDLYSDYQGQMTPGGAGTGNNGSNSQFKNKDEMEKFLNSTLVANRLLLVRFMDFTCDRGTSYQYRVRLEMRNPNFNRPIDELEQPELAEQRTVFSEWSVPSEPVFVPSAYRYYTQKVESRPRATELAHLSMYYQHETAGTPVLASLRVPVGVRVGGKQLLEVVDLGKSSLESQDVDLKSQDYLAGVAEAPRITQSDFPEMRELMKSIQRTKPVADRITIVDANGAIVSRFVGDTVTAGEKSISQADDEAKAKFVLDHYDNLRPQKADENANSLYGSGEGVGSGMMGSGGYGGLGDDYTGGRGKGSALGSSGGGSRGRGKRPGPGGSP